MSDEDRKPGDEPAPEASPAEPSGPPSGEPPAPAASALAEDAPAAAPPEEPSTDSAPEPALDGGGPPADPEATGAEAAPETSETQSPAPARVEWDTEALALHVEAMLLVTSRPLTVPQTARHLRTTFAAVRKAYALLGERYAGRGFQLAEVGGGYQFRTSAEVSDTVRRLLDVKPLRLSKAAVETLAIIAYRQPVTKPDVDEIRGVDCGGSVKLLLDRGLVRVLGRKEEPGRPLLYGTTQQFLEFFSLSALRDLPSLRDYADLTEDGRRQLERDLFARSPEPVAVTETDDEPILSDVGPKPVRQWEDLVEVMGDDLGTLPEGVEVMHEAPEVEGEPAAADDVPPAPEAELPDVPETDPEGPAGEAGTGVPQDDDGEGGDEE